MGKGLKFNKGTQGTGKFINQDEWKGFLVQWLGTQASSNRNPNQQVAVTHLWRSELLLTFMMMKENWRSEHLNLE